MTTELSSNERPPLPALPDGAEWVLKYSYLRLLSFAECEDMRFGRGFTARRPEILKRLGESEDDRPLIDWVVKGWMREEEWKKRRLCVLVFVDLTADQVNANVPLPEEPILEACIDCGLMVNRGDRCGMSLPRPSWIR